MCCFPFENILQAFYFEKEKLSNSLFQAFYQVCKLSIGSSIGWTETFDK